MTDLLWSDALESDQDVVRNNALVAAIVVLAYLLHSRGGLPWTKGLAVFLVLSAVVLRPGWLRVGWPWAILGAVLLVDVVRIPYLIANHHYVLTYVTFALALSLIACGTEAARLIRENARWLLVGIMGFALLHKLLSSAYVDGSYLAYMIASGNLGEVILGYCEPCMDAVQATAS